MVSEPTGVVYTVVPAGEEPMRGVDFISWAEVTGVLRVEGLTGLLGVLSVWRRSNRLQNGSDVKRVYWKVLKCLWNGKYFSGEESC